MITKILGFYYKVGSIDYPFNMSPNNVFGWNAVGGNAVFKYSVNDVERAFTSVRTIQKQSSYDTVVGDTAGGINVILAESGVTSDFNYSEVANEDVSSSFWNDVMQCAECIGRNQATIKGSPWDSAYDSYGDCMLGSSTNLDGSANNFYVSTYAKNSLTWKARANSNRIQWAQFTVSNVTLLIYYDADAWCERSDNVSYVVYRYEDLDSDDAISSTEMDKQVVTKLFDIMSEGKYKTKTSKLINKRISDTQYIQEQFFIFSSIVGTISDETANTAIKTYLRDKNNDDTYLRYTYPSLFNENEIRIIPIWDNELEQTSGGTQIVHPVTILKVAEVLSSFGFNISRSSSDYRAAEVFYVGPGSSWTPAVSLKYQFPLIAVEIDESSGVIAPISARFPTYKPVYGQNEKGDASEFHFILLTLLTHLANSTELSDDFVSEYGVSLTTSSNRKVATFTFANNSWSIYGPLK